jgi:hypothetical protein
MQIEIWDRETANGETVTMVVINDTGTQHANREAAFEYLRGLVRESRLTPEPAAAWHGWKEILNGKDE